MAFKNITAVLDGDGILRITSLPQINEGENVSVGLSVRLEEAFSSKQPQDVRFYFEFKCVDGKRYTTPPIQPDNGTLAYDVENSVLRGDGEAAVQVVAKGGQNYVFKSQQAAFRIDASINAQLPSVYHEDFLTQAQKLYDSVKTNISQLDGFKTELGQTNSQMTNLIESVNGSLASGAFIGPKGERGEQGPQGVKGDKGDRGEQGLQGIQGLQGERGLQGLQGERGLKGDKGDKGDQGERGLQGVQGIQGERGEQGLKGEKGDSAVLLWGGDGQASVSNIVWDIV